MRRSAPAEEPPWSEPPFLALPQPIRNYACGLSTSRTCQLTAGMAVLVLSCCPIILAPSMLTVHLYLHMDSRCLTDPQMQTAGLPVFHPHQSLVLLLRLPCCSIYSSFSPQGSGIPSSKSQSHSLLCYSLVC